MVISGEESSFQSIPSVFSLKVSSKLPRFPMISWCHVANYQHSLGSKWKEKKRGKAK